MTTIEIRWDATPTDRVIITAIAHRAADEIGLDMLNTEMDITACHLNGNPLDLEKLRDADRFNFAHDVCGIYRHIDRDTGRLRDFFSPRFSKPRQ